LFFAFCISIYAQDLGSELSSASEPPLSGGNIASAQAEAEDPELLEMERAFFSGTEESGAEASGGPGLFNALQVLLVLVLIALAIYGVVFLIRREPKRLAADDTHLKLLASIPLTPKTSAAVLSVGNKAWLAGVSESSVTLLAEIKEQEVIDTLRLEYARRAESAANRASSFLNFARAFLPRQKSEEQKEEPPKESPGEDLLRKNIDRLRGL
jgi:flagellar protein FliO/FliZ